MNAKFLGVIQGFAIWVIFLSFSCAAPEGPVISDNHSTYPNSQIPEFEKLEATFSISRSVAQNMQWPYDPNPPPGIKPGIGISVNAIFNSPSGLAYTQPAFYYQVFDDQVKNNQSGIPNQWFYPTGEYSWKIRFAPNEIGIWQYQITAQDASGTTRSTPQSFTVTSSSAHGFVKVSKNDPRYFEFDDGTYFPGLGYNATSKLVDPVNPILNNQSDFHKMSENGIQLIRVWLSSWSIFGSAWNPWSGVRNNYDGYLPRTGLSVFKASSAESSALTMKIVYAEDSVTGEKNAGNWFDACRFTGGFQTYALKQHTQYHIRIHFRAYDVTGPRNNAFADYGFVAKMQKPTEGNWYTNCYDSGVGHVISAYSQDTMEWSYLEGEFNSGSNNFMPLLYLVMENANNINPATGSHPSAYIDTISIAEDLGNGQYGPNLVYKPSMEYQNYFDQRNSYAFDKLLDLSEKSGVYLKTVVMEKNEDIENVIDYQGNFSNFDNNNFYGNYRTMTAVRWLQQSYWRYLQARWGYSPSIQSWELLNEGDPFNDRHYTLADEFAKYMHQFGPDSHLVSTSFWHSFPKDQFWANSAYHNIDFADIHHYIAKDSDPAHFYDTALMAFDESLTYGGQQTGGAGKPVFRGETGLIDSANNTNGETGELVADTNGLWLHNYLWAQLNSGGMLEQYWYSNYDPLGHIYSRAFDHRNLFGIYFNFIKDLPLNNGHYQDAAAIGSNANLRVWGQKDLVNGRVHLWIANRNHTWKNVVDRVASSPINGSVIISGFAPAMIYPLVIYDTYTGQATTQSTTTDASGNMILSVSNLTSDYAVKIGY